MYQSAQNDTECTECIKVHDLHDLAVAKTTGGGQTAAANARSVRIGSSSDRVPQWDRQRAANARIQ